MQACVVTLFWLRPWPHPELKQKQLKLTAKSVCLVDVKRPVGLTSGSGYLLKRSRHHIVMH